MLPAMKITEPYSPTRAGEGQGEAGQQAGADAGRITRAKGLPAARAEAGGGFFQFGVECPQHRLHACAPRTAGR